MDDRLRQLERAWRATNDPADEGRWLAALVHAGQLARGSLELAALLGAAGAQAAAPELTMAPGPDPWVDLRRWAAALDRRFVRDPRTSHRALLAEAERLLADLLAADAGPQVRRARAALDELAASVATAPVTTPSQEATLPLPDRQRTSPVGRLTRLLPILLGAVRSGQAVELERAWPSDLEAARAALGAAAAAAEPAVIRATLHEALVPWLLGRGDPLLLRGAGALDRLEIASPCPVRWEDLEGSDRVRTCDECRHVVYDLSALTRAEATALLRSTEGERLCVRLYRRADGKVLTRDCRDEERGEQVVRQTMGRRA